MAGDCGTCTMCCSVMAINELSKPKNILCVNCSIGVGCKIYDDRPPSCRVFRCLWLQTQTLGANALPLQMRPDKSKVVLVASPDEKTVIAKVHPNYPAAWKWKGIGLLLGQLSEKIRVLVDDGKTHWLLQNCQAKEVRMSAPDKDGTEHFERYV